MTISTKHYIDLKYAISDCLQRDNWSTLFELCRTNDVEISKTIAAIFSLYDPKNEWKFIDYVASLKPDERLHKWESIATVCYILGKIGANNIKKAIADLKTFLMENHMLRPAVSAALSNLWVVNSKVTAGTIYNSWIAKSGGNEDLQEVAVNSCDYLARNEPKLAAGFLKKVSRLKNRDISSDIAIGMVENYLIDRHSSRNVKTKHKVKGKKKTQKKIR